MGFFDKIKQTLFSTEKKTKQEEIVEQISEQQSFPSPVPKELWVCDACKGTIDVGERWSKQAGKYFHKQCYKLIKKSGGL